MMNACIYKPTEEALENGWDWDEIFAHRATEVVELFETYEEALEAYKNGNYDEEIYGVDNYSEQIEHIY